MSAAGRVVVIGAGPAGLAAARAAAQARVGVLLLDEQPAPGGQVWRNAGQRQQEAGAAALTGDSDAGAAAALEGLAHPRIEHVQGATVVDAAPDRRLGWLGPPGDAPRMRETRADALIVATGAMERPVPFSGWTLPGVMGVGALQLLLKQGVVPGGRLVLAGQGPLVLLTLAQLRRAGADVAALLDFGAVLPPAAALAQVAGLAADPALFARGMGLALRRAASGVPVHRHVRGLRAQGDTALTGAGFQGGEIACDILAVHDGVIPNTQLTRLIGLPHAWRRAEAAFAPVVDGDGRAAEGIWVAGDGAGIGVAGMAQAAGALAGLAAAQALGAPVDAAQMQACRASLARLRRARRLVEALYPPLPVSAHLDAATPICRCEAVTAAEIRAAVAAGAAGPNRVKVHTRCGMGPCQARMCGNALTRLLAEETGNPPDAVGALRIRPPLKPVLVDDYLAPENAA